METPRIEVRETPVGDGLFATAKFRRGQQIAVIEGKIIHEDDYGSEYCVGLGEGISLEPLAPYRFLNHSCDPNCELIIWDYEDTGEQELVLQTRKKIEPGAELTIDYSWPAEAAIECRCGSKKCRGWVVAKSELDRLPAAQTSAP